MKVGVGVSHRILFTHCEIVLSQLQQIIIFLLIKYLKLIITIVKELILEGSILKFNILLFLNTAAVSYSKHPACTHLSALMFLSWQAEKASDLCLTSILFSFWRDQVKQM